MKRIRLLIPILILTLLLNGCGKPSTPAPSNIPTSEQSESSPAQYEDSQPSEPVQDEAVQPEESSQPMVILAEIPVGFTEVDQWEDDGVTYTRYQGKASAKEAYLAFHATMEASGWLCANPASPNDLDNLLSNDLSEIMSYYTKGTAAAFLTVPVTPSETITVQTTIGDQNHRIFDME